MAVLFMSNIKCKRHLAPKLALIECIHWVCRIKIGWSTIAGIWFTMLHCIIPCTNCLTDREAGSIR